MVGDAYLTVFIALVTGYLLGSIPTAYLLTRWKTGRDIRQLGGGNVGGLNTFKAVSKPLAVAVVITDLAKGAAVILVTYFLFKFDRPYIVLSALAAVAGHNWMAWLKFSGGKGMGPTIGTMAVMLPVYHYYWQLAVFIGVVVVMLAVTRNVALSSGTSLVCLPFILWLYPPRTGQGLMVLWALALGIIILVKFTPTLLRALRRDSDIKHYLKGS